MYTKQSCLLKYCTPYSALLGRMVGKQIGGGVKQVWGLNYFFLFFFYEGLGSTFVGGKVEKKGAGGVWRGHKMQ